MFIPIGILYVRDVPLKYRYSAFGAFSFNVKKYFFKSFFFIISNVAISDVDFDLLLLI